MLCKRGLCRHAVSVCLCESVTFVDSVETSKHIFTFFHHRITTPFLFFRTKRHGKISTGTPPPNAGGIGKKSRFWANIWPHCVLSTLRTASCYQYGAAGLRSRKLWHLSLVVSGGVCWWRETTTTKCLWQEVSTLSQRQQNSISLHAVINL